MLEEGFRNIANWFGRQVAHIKAGIDEDVEAKKVIYRNDHVEEAKLPDRPNVTLRRTTIDEVIVEKKTE